MPPDAELSPLQKYLTDAYVDGWYLIPSKHFMNMEQSTLLAFGTIFLVLVICLVSWVVVEVKKRRQSA